MARREYQKPNVLRQDGERPYWYLRYRVRLYNRFERKEKWQRLGYCDEMTKREAERARDGLVVEVHNQVFTLRDQIPFRDFVSLYRRDFMPNLGLGTQQNYSSLFDTHLLFCSRAFSRALPGGNTGSNRIRSSGPRSGKRSGSETTVH